MISNFEMHVLVISEPIPNTRTFSHEAYLFMNDLHIPILVPASDGIHTVEFFSTEELFRRKYRGAPQFRQGAVLKFAIWCDGVISIV